MPEVIQLLRLYVRTGQGQGASTSKAETYLSFLYREIMSNIVFQVLKPSTSNGKVSTTGHFRLGPNPKREAGTMQGTVSSQAAVLFQPHPEARPYWGQTTLVLHSRL